MEGPRLGASSPSARTRRLRLRASLISRCTRLSRRLTSVIIELTVSRRLVRELSTLFRSSSRVVAGAATAAAAAASVATGAAATGTAAGAGAAAGAAAFLATFLAGVSATAGAATTGAAATGAGVSSVFLATRLPLVEAEAEFIILVPVEVFISIKRTEIKVRMGRSQFFWFAYSIYVDPSDVETFFFEIDPGDDGFKTCV